MIRKNAVTRFFYSFTCRENLYLVMEYLNGGDLYSLLGNLGCLDEDVARVARVYIPEVLTDFGLSKVGLINNTANLSDPTVSGTSLMGEHDESESSLSKS
nr:probable serine/threonine protein kinase IREH1 [Tanacetum cinerariifolium]